MKIKKWFAGMIGGVLFFAFSAVTMATPPRVSSTDFNKDMRKLWEDHITWTRLYIVDALADLPAKKLTADRLVLNQVDIGNAVKPYYGDAAGRKLTSLLKDHVHIAAEVIAAAKSGDTAKQNEAVNRWYTNSDDIADFLCGLNPHNWPAANMKVMLREHLDTTTDEVTAELTQDWAGDIRAYDELHGQILMMADVLSAGVIKQFPDKFKK